MEVRELKSFGRRAELREWLMKHHLSEKECWVVSYLKNKPQWKALPYLDIVEGALCFGWIDSTKKKLADGRLAQRLSPRLPKSHWTELNKERCKRLMEAGLMTETGMREWEKSAMVYERI